MVPEILFLKALREHNPALWRRSFPFHFGLYLLAGAGARAARRGGGRAFAGTAWLAGAAGQVARWTVAGMGWAGLVLAVFGALALLLRRMQDPALRAFTTAGDVFNLLFFVVALGTLGAGYVARPPGSADALGIAIGLLSWDSAVRLPWALAAGLVATAALDGLHPVDAHVSLHRQVLHLPRDPVGRCPVRRQPEDGGRARGLPGTAADVGCGAHEGGRAAPHGPRSSRRIRPTRPADDAPQHGCRTWPGGIGSRCSTWIRPICRRCRPNPTAPPRPASPARAESNADGYALDGTRALALPNPKTPQEEDALVRAFLSGLEKLFSRENNWTFLQPLLLSMEHCAHCQTCSEACHVFESSGRAEMYRPTYRSEVLQAALLRAREGRRPDLGVAARHRRIELAARRAARRAGLPVQPVPPVRPDVSDRRRQRTDRARNPQAVQPGARHRPEGTARSRVDAAAQGRLVDRHEPGRGQGQRAVHRRGDDREDRPRRRDAVGRRGRRHPADPQRGRDARVAREPGGLRRHPERRGHLVDDVVGDRRVRFRQLRRLVRRRPVREGRAPARGDRQEAQGEEDRHRRVRPRPQVSARGRRPPADGRPAGSPRELPHRASRHRHAAAG